MIKFWLGLVFGLFTIIPAAAQYACGGTSISADDILQEYNERSRTVLGTPQSVEVKTMYIIDGLQATEEEYKTLTAETIVSIAIMENEAMAAVMCRPRDRIILVTTKTAVTEPQERPMLEPTWYRQQDWLYFRLDDREAILKVEVVDRMGVVQHHQVGYDPARGVLMDGIPNEEPLILLLTTTRGRKTFPIQWAE